VKIDILEGDMFASGADSLVCPVNGIGVMGAGLAKTFLKRHVDASRIYQRECRSGSLAPGHVLPVISGYPPPRTLIYFAVTKDHWRNNSKIEWVRRCAQSLVYRALANASEQKSIAIPALGVGCGGLSWDLVQPILLDAAYKIWSSGVKVFLYLPR